MSSCLFIVLGFILSSLNDHSSKSCKGDFGAGAGLEAEITADHCTVTIASMSEVFAGEVELDLDMAEKVATLSLQRDIEAMELGFRDTHLRENVSATVQCNITGGFPAPEVSDLILFSRKKYFLDRVAELYFEDIQIYETIKKYFVEGDLYVDE